MEDIKLSSIYIRLKRFFDEYERIWVFSPKGDHLANMQLLGLVKEVDLIYAVSTLGGESTKLIKSSMKSYREWLETYEESFERELENLKSQNGKTLIVSPFPNRKLVQFIKNNPSLKITLITTAKDLDTFYSIEDKIKFSYSLEEILGKSFKENIIPWKVLDIADDFKSFSDNEFSGSFFLQRSEASTGGDGTVLINNIDKYKYVITNNEWIAQIKSGSVKVSKEIKMCYPSNGTGCIIPKTDGGCYVYVDPPSHKPVKLKEFNIIKYDSAGNDWSNKFSQEIDKQYINIVKLIGEYLFKKYGYTGIFGPDALIVNSQDKKPILFINEINPRWQGTTPYQTLNALKNNRIPLEIIHYLLRFYEINNFPFDEINKLIDDEQTYNSNAMNEIGGFYIKIKCSGENIVTNDLNGCWGINIDTFEIKKHDNYNDFIAVYTQKLKSENPAIKFFFIKAPKKGEIVGDELVPVAYVFGSEIDVFEKDRPASTRLGKVIFDFCKSQMFA